MENQDFSKMMNMASLFSSLFNQPSADSGETKHKNTSPVISNPQSAYFDDYINNDSMRMIKSAIPFLEIGLQKNLALLIKFVELKYTIDYFSTATHNNIPSVQGNRQNMLFSMKQYCNDDRHQCLLDLILKSMDMKKVFESLREYSAPIAKVESINNTNKDTNNDTDLTSILSSMLSPEQQSMFETFKTLMKENKEEIENEPSINI